MTGNTVSLQEVSNIETNYATALNSPNTITGDETLFLKGGLGSMAVIELFGQGSNPDVVPEQLVEFRANNWMINEASLTFYVERTKLGSIAPEPDRIYLYDLNNNRPLLDYFTDGTEISTRPKSGKFVHDGIIQKLPSDYRGEKYRIRITNHVANLLRKDSTNVRLGLVVTEDYRIVSNMDRKTPAPADLVTKAPLASVMNPLGTILHGNTSTNPDRRPKLEIFYTKIN